MNRAKSVFIIAIVFLLASATGWSASETSEPEATAIIKNLWLNLGKTTNQCPQHYDYFPEGGIRIFYCHAKSLLSYEQLKQLAKLAAFTKGPHTESELVLDAKYDFGYYQPTFVKWLRENLIPALKEPAFRELSQSVYDQYVKSLARTYYMVYERLRAAPVFVKQEQETLLHLTASKQLPTNHHTQYYEFADLHKQGFDGNVVTTSVAFWIRRVIDGTAEDFFTALKALLTIYDNGFLTTSQNVDAKSKTELTPTALIWSTSATIHPQVPEFTFKFFGRNLDDSMVNVTRIEVFQAGKSEPVQVIDHLDTYTIINADNGLHVKIEDINFDGYQDIRMMSNLAEGPIPYLCWLFEPSTKLFKEIPELSGLSFEVDAENQLLISAWNETPLRQRMDYYQFLKGKPVLIKQEIMEYSKEEEGVYQLTVKKLIGDTLRVVEQKRVEEENRAAAEVAEELTTFVKEVWQNLAITQEPCLEEPLSGYEIGSIVNFYCQLKKRFGGYKKLQTLANSPIYLKGPHNDNQLNLNAKSSFGYYNEAFVKWLGDNFIPQDLAFKNLTQPIFDNYVKELARTFYLVHELLWNDLDYLKKEQTLYLELLKKRQLPYGYALKYSSFKGLKSKGYREENVATAVSFWLRRITDGTEDEFFTALKSLLMTYDTEFAEDNTHHIAEWEYSASVHTTPPTFTFKLFKKPAETEASADVSLIDKIEIYRNQELYPFQRIEGLAMQMIADDEGFSVEDMNFDGYQDFRVAGTYIPNFYWLFDPQEQKFVRNKALEQLEQVEGTLQFDAMRQQLKLIWHQGAQVDWEEDLHGINFYEFDSNKPILVKQEIYQVFWQTAIADNDTLEEDELDNSQEFTIVTILERNDIVGDEMKVIQQKLVPGNLVKEKFSLEENDDTLEEEVEPASEPKSPPDKSN